VRPNRKTRQPAEGLAGGKTAVCTGDRVEAHLQRLCLHLSAHEVAAMCEVRTHGGNDMRRNRIRAVAHPRTSRSARFDDGSMGSESNVTSVNCQQHGISSMNGTARCQSMQVRGRGKVARRSHLREGRRGRPRVGVDGILATHHRLKQRVA
jgi:hypothetical protein